MTPPEAPPDGPPETPPETITGAVLARADDPRLGLVAGDVRLSHAEVVAQAASGQPGCGPAASTARSTSR